MRKAKAKHEHSALVATGVDWSQTYPVTITDKTASPRYNPGEVVHVHPNLPVHPGNWVLVVQKSKEEGASPVSIVGKFLAALVDGDQRTVILHRPQYGDCELKDETVLTIHRIVGSSEADT